MLYACESGSRAGEFPSPNSDYDVCFIYAQDLDWHLSLRDQKDSIDLPINDLFDIGGGIQESPILLGKSNEALLEWLPSPIVYREGSIFLRQMRELGQAFFSPISVMHHYITKGWPTIAWKRANGNDSS